MGSGDGKYFPGWKCAAGCAAGPAGARRAAAAALRWPRLPRSDSRCGGGAKSRPSMPGPGPGPPPPPGSSAAGARGRLGARAARGRRAGGGVRVTGGGGAGQQAGGLGSSAGGRAPSRRPPCGSIVCGGKQRRLGDWGLGPFPRPPGPLRPRATARPHGGSPHGTHASWATRLPGPRAHTHRPGHARPGRAPGSPAHRSPLPLRVPAGPGGEGAAAKGCWLRGAIKPQICEAITRAHTHTHTRAHTLSPPPPPRGVSGEGPGRPRPRLPSRRGPAPLHAPSRVTVLIKRVILLIVTQEFFL